MFKEVKTHKKFVGLSNIEHAPIKTLKDEHGAICHIIVDDGCYVCYLYVEESGFIPVIHIFSELHTALCTLNSPDLIEEA